MGNVIEFRPRQEGDNSEDCDTEFKTDNSAPIAEVITLDFHRERRESQKRRELIQPNLASLAVLETNEPPFSSSALDIKNYLTWKIALSTLIVGRAFDANKSNLVKTYTDEQLVHFANTALEDITVRPRFYYAISEELFRRGLVR